MRSNRTRRAITLLEVIILIVVAIMAVSLLLPNVRYSREAARRMSCSQNLHVWELLCTTTNRPSRCCHPTKVEPARLATMHDYRRTRSQQPGLSQRNSFPDTVHRIQIDLYPNLQRLQNEKW